MSQAISCTYANHELSILSDKDQPFISSFSLKYVRLNQLRHYQCFYISYKSAFLDVYQRISLKPHSWVLTSCTTSSDPFGFQPMDKSSPNSSRPSHSMLLPFKRTESTVSECTNPIIAACSRVAEQIDLRSDLLWPAISHDKVKPGN